MSQAADLANKAVQKSPDSNGSVQLTDGGTAAKDVPTAQANLQVDPAGTAVALAIALG